MFQALGYCQLSDLHGRVLGGKRTCGLPCSGLRTGPPPQVGCDTFAAVTPGRAHGFSHICVRTENVPTSWALWPSDPHMGPVAKAQRPRAQWPLSAPTPPQCAPTVCPTAAPPSSLSASSWGWAGERVRGQLPLQDEGTRDGRSSLRFVDCAERTSHCLYGVRPRLLQPVPPRLP